MEGYHLRSQSIPVEEAWTSTEVPSTSSTASHATTERPEEGLVSEGHSLVLAEQPGAGISFVMGTHDFQASSDRREVTLRALLASPPQESSSNVSATLDVAETLDPEAEVYTNAEASISLPDLEMEAAANVGAFISPPAWMWRFSLASDLPLA